MLTREQYERFWREGYLVVEEAVTPAQLAALRAAIAGWCLLKDTVWLSSTTQD